MRLFVRLFIRRTRIGSLKCHASSAADQVNFQIVSRHIETELNAGNIAGDLKAAASSCWGSHNMQDVVTACSMRYATSNTVSFAPRRHSPISVSPLLSYQSIIFRIAASAISGWRAR